MAKRRKSGLTRLPPESNYDGLLSGVSELLERARVGIVRTSNSILTATYWEIGRRIVEFEQGGKARADYGTSLLKRLAIDLTEQHGRGYSERNLEQMRGFYLGWQISQTPSAKLASADIPQTLSAELGSAEILPTPSAESVKQFRSAKWQARVICQTPSGDSRILQTPSAESLLIPADQHVIDPQLFARLTTAFPLSWSQYVRLLSVDDPHARAFYETEAIRGGWSVRQLDRQISTQFYQRLALSKRKAAMLEKALIPLPEDAVTVEDVIRDPYLLEFLNLKDEYSESDLEEAIIRHLEWFLLELGEGFTFVARQKRIRIGDTWYRIDLLLYHRDLRCLVIVDLKIGKFTHADAGQMNLYLNYAGEHMTRAGENPPVGIILCSEKDDAVVKYATGGIKTQVFASKYLEVLPDAEKLRQEILSTQRAFAAHDAARPKSDTKGTKRKPT